MCLRINSQNLSNIQYFVLLSAKHLHHLMVEQCLLSNYAKNWPSERSDFFWILKLVETFQTYVTTIMCL
jgi:hypothetical protein